MRHGRRRPAALLGGLAAVGSLALLTPPAGATQIWSAPVALPAGASTAHSEIFTSPTGQMMLFFQINEQPAIATFDSSGNLSAPTLLSPAPGFGASGFPRYVAFLPNGDAVLSWEPGEGLSGSGELALQYRFAGGKLGPVLKPQAFSSFDARSGELLVMEASGGIKAQSFSIGPNGEFTSTHAGTPIYEGETLFGQSWTALDPGGSADVLINGVEKGIIDVSRNSSGIWGAPVEVGKPTNNAAAAVAPGGRAIAQWQFGEKTTAHGGPAQVIQYAAIREPGGNFHAAQVINSLEGKGGVEDRTLLAAGGDGTLAMGVQSYSCPTEGPETATSSGTVYIAPPGSGLSGAGVPGDSFGAFTHTSMGPLGADEGAAIVGTFSSTSLNPEYSETTCEDPQPTLPAGTHFEYTYGVQVIGGKHPTSYGFGTTNTESGKGAPRKIDAVGLDLFGNASVLGGLSGQGLAQLVTFGPPDIPQAGEIIKPPPPPENHAAVRNTAPTPGAIVGSPGVNTSGQQTVTITNPNEYGVMAGVVELTHGAFAAGKRAPKNITIASKRVVIPAHRKATVRLKLSSAALKFLRKHHKLAAILQVTLSAAGRPSTVVGKHLVLKLLHHR